MQGRRPIRSDKTRLTRKIVTRIPVELHDLLIDQRAKSKVAINTIVIKAITKYLNKKQEKQNVN